MIEAVKERKKKETKDKGEQHKNKRGKGEKKKQEERKKKRKTGNILIKPLTESDGVNTAMISHLRCDLILVS